MYLFWLSMLWKEIPSESTLNPIIRKIDWILSLGGLIDQIITTSWLLKLSDPSCKPFHSILPPAGFSFGLTFTFFLHVILFNKLSFFFLFNMCMSTCLSVCLSVHKWMIVLKKYRSQCWLWDDLNSKYTFATTLSKKNFQFFVEYIAVNYDQTT